LTEKIEPKDGEEKNRAEPTSKDWATRRNLFT
jgi:hypothetical protein